MEGNTPRNHALVAPPRTPRENLIHAIKQQRKGLRSDRIHREFTIRFDLHARKVKIKEQGAAERKQQDDQYARDREARESCFWKARRDLEAAYKKTGSFGNPTRKIIGKFGNPIRKKSTKALNEEARKKEFETSLQLSTNLDKALDERNSKVAQLLHREEDLSPDRHNTTPTRPTGTRRKGLCQPIRNPLHLEFHHRHIELRYRQRFGSARGSGRDCYKASFSADFWLSQLLALYNIDEKAFENPSSPQRLWQKSALKHLLGRAIIKYSLRDVDPVSKYDIKKLRLFDNGQLEVKNDLDIHYIFKSSLPFDDQGQRATDFGFCTIDPAKVLKLAYNPSIAAILVQQ
ncbi:hypothetical protein G7Y89_g7085 [Cudoniella acicularis]|uniref:Uncharacterized protein n=1 Tax=Cudoniella acicularis TaxID=354080 RepID=A0A8H4W2E8_9HELO|nr:hypothetical protein G7Y89_g7085 [Cudoniella acicularis]